MSGLSIFRAIKLPWRKDLGSPLFPFFLSESSCTQKKNLWQSYFPDLVAFSQIMELRKDIFLHLLNLVCLELKIIFIPK